MSAVWPVVPVEFIAEIGTYLIDDAAIPARFDAFTKEIETHFMSGGAPGAQVEDRFPHIGLIVRHHNDDSGAATNTVRVASVMVKFLNTTVDDAMSYAATYTPKAKFIEAMTYRVITKEVDAARRAGRDAQKKAAEALISSNAARDAEKAEQDKAAARDKEFKVDDSFSDLV